MIHSIRDLTKLFIIVTILVTILFLIGTVLSYIGILVVVGIYTYEIFRFVRKEEKKFKN